MTVLERDAVLLRGFDHPVDDAQETFRVLLNAMATPGRVMDLAGPKECPEGLSGPAAAVLLSLTDFSTALWIDPCLPYRNIESYVGFHAGARTTQDSDKSGFALIARNADEIGLHRFQSGTPEYPDRSTTIIIEVDRFDVPDCVRVSGPGIEKPLTLGAGPLPRSFWFELSENAATFPLGYDVILTAPASIMAIPRSTRIEVL